MITINHNSETHEFKTLDEEMAWAKELNEFVTIQFDGMEVAGKFGADGIVDGKFHNRETYKWKKRRKH